MACSTCSTGSPNGCQNTGHCATGGCNKLNTYDWLASYDFEDPTGTDIVEISFKKGARKEFYRNHAHNPAQIKEVVVVDTGNGYDVGVLSLAGELVRLQMKKKRVKEASVTNPVIRVANDRDIERLNEYRALEQQAMVRARAISGTLGLEMKVCDVEYRGDGRKATFYYTAEGRVDFRELVRLYAKEFQVKVEMRQIGARQESSRIGGIGSCGRELCCSTWLTDFKSVNTHAARYQNLSINQAKLSGQCGRLKCCLNYELDTYMEAMEEFPQGVDVLKSKSGNASLIKIDIFKRQLYYSAEMERGKNTMLTLSLERVQEIREMNERGEFPEQLQDPNLAVEEEKLDYADVTGDIELPDYKKKKKKKKKSKGQEARGQERGNQRPPQQDTKKQSGKPAHHQDRNQGQKTPGDANAAQSRPTGESKNQGQQKPGQQGQKSKQPKRHHRHKHKGPRPEGGQPPKPNPPQS
jgi:cell fate regulator YaaT (PSP1 superfamily)